MTEINVDALRNTIHEAMAQRLSTGEELAEAAGEFLKASARFVAAHNEALKAGWTTRDLKGFPDPTKPVKAAARRAGKPRAKKPAQADTPPENHE
ncbi:MAG: hypothetical protein Q4P71_09090 [Actinomycetaceae bacterium]|nr:hypothetical protein [Actinomycetaceae bacterium]